MDERTLHQVSKLTEEEKNTFYQIITSAHSLNKGKNATKASKTRICIINQLIAMKNSNRNHLAVAIGLFHSENFICVNYSRLSSILSCSRSFIRDYFSRCGYSNGKKCTVQFIENKFPELLEEGTFMKKWVVRFITEECSVYTFPTQTTTNINELTEELRTKLINILNIGALSKEKANELLCVIKDKKYSAIPTSVLSKMPLFSPSFFYKHRESELLHDGRKGASGRKAKLTRKEEEKIIEVCTHRRQELLVVSLRWTVKQVETLFSIKVSLTYIHNLFTRFNWRSVRVQSQHPDQINPIVETLVINFFNYLWDFIIEHKLSPCNLHIMDETGLYTNTLPRTTYSPKGEGGFCVGGKSTVKDTAIVTLTANGSGHLFYVPTIGEETKIINDKKIDFKKRSGVGNLEMIEWVKSFLNYSSKGDLLLLDNLSAHKNLEVQRILRENGIHYEFFPVRCAFILSVLDNAFFAVIKNNISYLEEHEETKLDDIKKVFTDLVHREIPKSFFNHCKYDSIFDSANYEFEEKHISSVATEIGERDENYGKYDLPQEVTISEIIGSVSNVYDSSMCSISSVLYFVFENTYMQSILTYAEDPLCLATMSIIEAMKTTQKMQIKKQRIHFFNFLERNGFIVSEDAATNSYKFLSLLLSKANYCVTIDKFINPNEITQLSETIIDLNQTKSIEESIQLYFNIMCNDSRHVKIIHTTEDYQGSFPEILVFRVKFDNATQQFSYNNHLDMSYYNIKGIQNEYSLYSIFAESLNNEKKGVTLYVNVNEQWIGFHGKPFITDVQHVSKRLQADIGYGRAFMFVYQKIGVTNPTTVVQDLRCRQCFKLWNPKKMGFVVPIIKKVQKYDSGDIRKRIFQRLDERAKEALKTKQKENNKEPGRFPIPEINANIILKRENQKLLAEAETPIDDCEINDINRDDNLQKHENISLSDVNGAVILSESENEESTSEEENEESTSEKENKESTSEGENMEINDNDMLENTIKEELPNIFISDDPRVIDAIENQVSVSFEEERNIETRLSLKYQYNYDDIVVGANGIANPGNYCYINVTLQLLMVLPEVKELLATGYENQTLKAIDSAIKALTETDNEINIMEYFPPNEYNRQTDLLYFINKVVESMKYKTLTEDNAHNGTFSRDIHNLFKVCCAYSEGIPKYDEIIIDLNIIDSKSVVEALNRAFELHKILKLPKYMLIHLNRSKYNPVSNSTTKILKRVKIDKSFHFGKKKYHIKAIITHTGNTSGHFVIYIFNGINWICFNDSRVNIADEYEINEKIEGDDYIDEKRSSDQFSNIVKDIADTMRTAVFMLYSK